MKKIISVSTILLFLLASCTPQYYYQVYEVKSEDVIQDGNVLFYENSDCRITYNLWSEGGNLNFLIYNKTNDNLFVIMPQSFFILNGVANDYYSESSYSYRVTNSAALTVSNQVSISGYLANGNYWYPSTLSRQLGAQVGTSITTGIETKEREFVCIPPMSL